MKVLLMNGSPNEKGCTYTALSEVAKSLNSFSIDTEIYYVGEDVSKETLLKVKDMCAESDGFVIGSPVYYASATGSLTHFLDKIFGVAGKDLAYKPGATVVSCRRGGASSTFEQVNKYFTINNMPVVSSNYWNMVHGNTPAEVVQDEEQGTNNQSDYLLVAAGGQQSQCILSEGQSVHSQRHIGDEVNHRVVTGPTCRRRRWRTGCTYRLSYGCKR